MDFLYCVFLWAIFMQISLRVISGGRRGTMFVWRMHAVSPADVDLKCKCSKAFTLVAVRQFPTISTDVTFLFFVLDPEASSSDFISFIRPSFDFVLKVKFYMWQTDKGEKQSDKTKYSLWFVPVKREGWINQSQLESLELMCSPFHYTRLVSPTFISLTTSLLKDSDPYITNGRGRSTLVKQIKGLAKEVTPSLFASC